jgi:glycosyltransferase involved in cell wall biosynthesis
MKVIQVMPEFGLAGAEIMCENLCYGLLKNGHNVVVVSFYNYKSEITKRLKEHGIHIIYLGKKKGFDSSIINKLRKIFIDEKPEIVHTHRYVLPYVFLASIGLPPKIIHTVHNVADKEVERKQQAIQKILFHTTKITPVAISPIVKESIAKRYNITNNQIPMIFNGIDLKKCIPKTDYDLHDNITILHIGRFSPQKNHMRLIDSFETVQRKYPNAYLSLIGEGELETSIKKYVREKGLSDFVRFLGTTGNVYPYLSNSDLFVLSSNYEGMPLTLIEAMATGIPIVSTEVGGISDMIENGVSGKLVPCNCESISNALLSLLSNEEERRSLGEKARADSKKFSQEIMTENYLELYEKVSV